MTKYHEVAQIFFGVRTIRRFTVFAQFGCHIFYGKRCEFYAE